MSGQALSLGWGLFEVRVPVFHHCVPRAEKGPGPEQAVSKRALTERSSSSPEVQTSPLKPREAPPLTILDAPSPGTAKVAQAKREGSRALGKS